MKKAILIFSFYLLGTLLYAQERVAILPFTGGEDGEGDAIAQILGTELTKLKILEIAPRTEVLNKVMEEQDFQRGGITDENTIVAIGRGVNAKYVVSGHIQNLGERKMILASILNIETLQQIAGDYFEYEQLDEVIDYLPTLAGTLASKTKKDYSALPTLAVLPFDDVDKNTADVLAQLLSIELANSGEYVVVSRSSAITKAMDEQNIQRNGLTDENTISKLGKAINAQYVLSGNVLHIGAINLLNVAIIDMSSLVQMGGAYAQYNTIEDGSRLMSELCYDLTEAVANALSLEHAIAMYEGEQEKINGNSVIELIKDLVSDGINATDTYGRTSLVYASWYGYVELVKSLIAEGANVESMTNDGNTALILASYNGQAEVIRVLIKAGADLDTKDSGGFTALMFAAAEGHIEVVKALLLAHADIDATTYQDNTTLMFAATEGYTEIVQFLIAVGADLNAQNNKNWTALILASYKGHTEVVKALVSANADFNLKGYDGNTALDDATQNGHTEIVRLLENAGAR